MESAENYTSGGYTDWRLLNIEELEWFRESESMYYWSSATYVSWGIVSVWVVDFAGEDGSRGGSNPTVNHLARVVRAF